MWCVVKWCRCAVLCWSIAGVWPASVSCSDPAAGCDVDGCRCCSSRCCCRQCPGSCQRGRHCSRRQWVVSITDRMIQLTSSPAIVVMWNNTQYWSLAAISLLAANYYYYYYNHHHHNISYYYYHCHCCFPASLQRWLPYSRLWRRCLRNWQIQLLQLGSTRTPDRQ